MLVKQPGDAVYVLTRRAKVDIAPWQYQRIKEARKRYAETQLHKQDGGQQTEASECENKSVKEEENEEALKKCDGMWGEPSDSSLRPSGSQEVDKVFVSKGVRANIQTADPMEESGHDPKADAERLSPKYQIEDDPTVENGLMMPTLPSTPPWEKVDSPPQPVDVPKLTEYLNRHKHEFRHICNQPVESVIHPIHDQSMFLNERQKKQLKKEFGCPHQVRNIQSCIKVALDFVTPESVEEYLRLTQEIRRLPEDHRFSEDRLEIKKIVMHAASSAIREAKALMQNSMTQ
ncbi:hypothetical protein F2Q69_00002856 [Brassica cretica]|uniref:JmjC domain-containing protein n=1 Tax=Brassica cretica TaxID=69181 RepID=A0A8S9NZN5_BRACR|nr:hypothetical protein F2Q69_00002856 [Brassica cretica]